MPACRYRLRRDVSRLDVEASSRLGRTKKPAFRHLSPEEYRDRVAELIWEIEEEGEPPPAGSPIVTIRYACSR